MNKNNPPSLSIFQPVVFTIGNRKQTPTCEASGIVCCYPQPQESQSNKRKYLVEPSLWQEVNCSEIE